MTPDQMVSRRAYLTMKALLSTKQPVPLFMAMEAVSSTAIEHPEWDMTEERTWDEWESATAR